MAQNLRDVLMGALNRAGLARSATGAMAVLQWPEFVGPEIAAHARATTLQRGVLTVVVDSHVWATELSTLIPVLLERIGSTLGDGTVAGIRFHVGQDRSRPRGSAFRGEGIGDNVPPPWPGRGDLDGVKLTGDDQECIHDFAARIGDPELARAAGNWLALTLKARRWLGRATERRHT